MNKCRVNKESCTGYHNDECVSIENCEHKVEMITRADKIRNMSDEELADFLLDMELDEYKFSNHFFNPFVKIMAWLQELVKK